MRIAGRVSSPTAASTASTSLSRRCSSPATRCSCRIPEWPPTQGTSLAAHGVPVPVVRCTSHLGWRFDLDELESKITARTRVILHQLAAQPDGRGPEPADVERIASIAREHDLWVISDEATKTSSSTARSTSSPASLPGMYERTIPIYMEMPTFSLSLLSASDC